jgi:hypothetical protein
LQIAYALVGKKIVSRIGAQFPHKLL